MIFCKRNQMQCYNFFQQFRHDYRLVFRLILTITHRNAFHWYAARRLHWKWKVSSCNYKLGSLGRHTGGFYANCYGIHRYVHFKFLRMHTALELCVYECFMSFYKIFPVYFAFYISYISYSAAVAYKPTTLFSIGLLVFVHPAVFWSHFAYLDGVRLHCVCVRMKQWLLFALKVFFKCNHVCFCKKVNDINQLCFGRQILL